MQNFEETLLSQYANSATLVQWITSFNGWVDPRVNLDEFYRLVWNVDSAEGYGLDVWGRIVGVSRQLTVTAPETYFGFEDGVNDYAPFNVAPFWNGTPVTQNYTLSDEAYRTLILIKAATNIARTVTPKMNELLTMLFAGRGRCYVNNLGHMRIRYTFEFYLEPFELAILTQSGALPRPTGVGIDLIQVPQGSTFGFNEAGDGMPFNEGVFLSQEAVINAG